MIIIGSSIVKDCTFRDNKNVFAFQNESALSNCTFKGIESGIQVNGASLEKCFFLAETTTLQSTATTFIACEFRSKLQEAMLGGGVKFDGCDFQFVEIHPTANFKKGVFKNGKISRIALAMFEPEGKPPICEQLKMDVKDDLSVLRQECSGFWQYIHTLALFLFLSPYILFILLSVIKTSMTLGTQDLNSPTLLYALLRFSFLDSNDTIIITSLIFVIFCVLYNALRIRFLYLTKKLKLSQESRGLPVIFNLTKTQRIWFVVYSWCFYINVAVVSLHLLNFGLRHVVEL